MFAVVFEFFNLPQQHRCDWLEIRMSMTIWALVVRYCPAVNTIEAKDVVVTRSTFNWFLLLVGNLVADSTEDHLLEPSRQIFIIDHATFS